MAGRASSIYYGWWITAGYYLILMITVGAIFGSFGLFVLPVSTEFGLSRAEVNSAFILLNVGVAIIAPFLGTALDRLPARRLMLAAIILFGASFAILSLSRSLWLSGMVMLVALPVVFLAAGTITSSIVLSRWFTAHRGRAILLAQAGAPSGSIILIPPIAWLIVTYGWRPTLAIIGVIGTVALLAILIFIRERPRPGEHEPGAVVGTAGAARPAAPPRAPHSVGGLLRMRLFWLTAISYALPACMGQALTVSMVPLALGSGLTTAQSATLLSLAGFAALVSSVSVSIVADKIRRVTLLLALVLVGTVMSVLPLFDQSYPVLALTCILIGISSGTLPPTFFALFADRFGVASLGTVRGLIQPVSAIFAIGSIRFSGEVFDRTGNYDLLFEVLFGLHLVAAGLIFASDRLARKTQASLP